MSEKLTEQEVNQVLNAFDFLEFSQGYNSEYYGLNRYFTPDVINQQMQNINMNPTPVKTEDVVKALNSPKTSEEILREYSMALELNDMYYKRLLHYFADMPCFNITWECINAEKQSDYSSKEFKEDLRIVDDFLSRFNCREEFKIVLRQILRQDAYFCVLRDDGVKFTLQELPADFCKITGRHAYGILYDFNMQYFMGQPGVDINMFPKVMRKMYRQIYKQMTRDYDPAMKANKRHSSFIYWHQCNPSDGFWAFKAAPEIATLLPYFAPLFPDISMAPTARKLQEDKYFIAASKLIVGLLGFNKESKSGQVPNQINITPEVLGKFLGLARRGIREQIGLTALPVDKVEVVEFDTNNTNLIDDQTSAVAKQSVASSSVLMHDGKLSVHESKLAAAVDANVVKTMYPMFANFVEYFVNQRTSKYKFKFEFHDVDIPDDKEFRRTTVKEMSALGIVDFQDVARVYDINVFQLKRRLQASKAMDFEKEITDLLIPSSRFGRKENVGVSENLNETRTGVTGTGRPRGRPRKENSENESTVASIERDSNLYKSL